MRGRTVSTVPDGPPPPRVRQAIRRGLLRWYDRNARDLPWRRRASDPYAQWVAEIMLQQTQVDTVIPYYQRFMKRFPDVQTLACATNDQLMRHWQGLGYYRRAANLHRAATEVTAGGGAIPDSAESLRALSGVGRYTAGAIASIAYGERVAAVDGNVARILCRLFNITDEVSRNDTARRLWSLAEALLPRKRCGDFNQAWMDLGATVCTPAAPRCDRCPLRGLCRAHERGDPGSLPTRSARRAVLDVRHVVAVIRHKDAYLLMRRPVGGLWSGLWEFPNRRYARAADRLPTLRELSRDLGAGSIEAGSSLGCFVHRLTHRVMHFDTHLMDVPRRRSSSAPTRTTQWVGSADLGRWPMSSACRKMLLMVRSRGDPRAPGR